MTTLIAIAINWNHLADDLWSDKNVCNILLISFKLPILPFLGGGVGRGEGARGGEVGGGGGSGSGTGGGKEGAGIGGEGPGGGGEGGRGGGDREGGR